MNYLYEAIKPTRLYIKQCPHCGLKYFGKHSGQDIEKYPGGGKYWSRHLKKHEVEPVHLWNSDWYYDTSISRFALKFSHINKIVESDIWANLKLENGLDGGWELVNENGLNRNDWHDKNNISHMKKMSFLGNLKKKWLFENDEEWVSDYSKSLSDARKIQFETYGHPWTGRTHSEEAKQKIGKQNAKKQKGKGNSQYGTMWITDGFSNKKILRHETIPDGWRKGRKIKVNNE
jgi:hypothetical protein